MNNKNKRSADVHNSHSSLLWLIVIVVCQGRFCVDEDAREHNIPYAGILCIYFYTQSYRAHIWISDILKMIFCLTLQGVPKKVYNTQEKIITIIIMIIMIIKISIRVFSCACFISTRAHNLCHDNLQLIVITINRNRSAIRINCN